MSAQILQMADYTRPERVETRVSRCSVPGCKRIATKRCDYRLSGDLTGGTCDADLCAACAAATIWAASTARRTIDTPARRGFDDEAPHRDD